MERLCVGVICNCMYDNEEENGVINNVVCRGCESSILAYMIYTSLSVTV